MIANQGLIIVIEFLLAAVVLIAILRQPYLGLAIVVATQPVLGLIPSIPLVSSIVPLIGAITIFSLMMNPKTTSTPGNLRLSPELFFTVFFIVWFFATNPTAALMGSDRNWVFTFFQLLILLWLAGFLLDTPYKHRMVMWLFSIATLLTAIATFQQGGFLEEIDPLVRATGITQGANTAARYFVVSFVFFNYLLTSSHRWGARLIALLGVVATFLGVFYTVSRTGMLLLGIAIILLLVLQSSIKYRLQIALVATIAAAVLVTFSSSIFDFMQGIFPAIAEGSDTVGLRYALWKAGWQMWLDHPINGVGMGMFPSMLRYYPNPAYNFFFFNGLVAHNMYVSILAETGLVGFLLFMGLIISSLAGMIGSRNKLDSDFKQIATVWLIVLFVMLLGGITKTDQVDKLLWLAMGTSVFFARKAAAVPTRKENSTRIISRVKATRPVQEMPDER